MQKALRNGENCKYADQPKENMAFWLSMVNIFSLVTMVVAVWTCALWLAFGMQPKLAIAILLGSTVLSVAGLVLQAYDRQVTNR